MTKGRSLFGTSGIRGSEIELFTDQFCFDIGRTFSIFLKNHNSEGPVALGMDPRGSSPRIKNSVASGLVFEGREVFDEGATPVPSMCYLLKVNDYYAGSIMVSGSHIKAELNGIKFFAFGEEILKNHEKEIEEIYRSIKSERNYKNLSSTSEVHDDGSAFEEYKNMLLAKAKGPYPNWKVVVDPVDGAQSDTMPYILKALGVNVIEVHATIQGEFYARDTEHIPDMQELMGNVNKYHADFGIGYDADGDRVVFVDENGEFIPGDYSGSIIAREEKGSKVVTTISSSQVIDLIGKNITRTKVGAPYVIEAMKKINARFGFEPNGGSIFTEIMMTRDGGSTTIKFLNILNAKNKSISKLIAELPKFYLFKGKIDYKWEQRDQIESEARRVFKDYKIDGTDGLKIWVDNTTWILFRSSLNAPEFRIFAESETENSAKLLLDRGLNLVKNIVEKV